MIGLMKKYFLPILLAVLLLSSCTVTESFNMNNNKSGVNQTEINVEEFFIELMEDFASFTPDGDYSIVDNAISDFAYQLGQTTVASRILFYTDGDNNHYGTFNFSALDNLFRELSRTNQTIIRQTNNSISFNLSIDNYYQLERIVPLLTDPNLEVYLPLYNQGMEKEDYIDMIWFTLGDEAPDAIERSKITIKITTPGDISSFTNGKKISSREFEYTFELIDFLLLSTPLSFSLTWN